MFKFAAKLSDDFEYAIIDWGQSNDRCWGTQASGFAEAPHLDLEDAGRTLTIIDGFAVAGGVSELSTGLGTELTASLLVGMELRLGTVESPKVGYGTVVSHTIHRSLSVVSAAAPGALELTFDHPNDKVIWPLGHTTSTGAVVVITGTGTAPTGLAKDTVYYAISVSATELKFAATYADAFTATAIPFTSNGVGALTLTTAPTIVVEWNADVVAGVDTTATGAWAWRDKWKTYDNVRVLTPYLPEEPGEYPAGPPDVPGYTFPEEIDSYEKTGVFLPFTFLEGVEGPGVVGTGHASTAPTATTYTISTQLPTANLYAGGWIRVGGSVGKIKTHDAANPSVFTLTSAGWTGGTPTTGLEYEVFVGHQSNNPHSVTPGFGFRYPSNDPMPWAFGNGDGVYNRPRGKLSHQYGETRFGAMLEMAWRLSLLIGKRVHVVHLAVNSAGQFLAPNSNAFGFQGTIGFWNDNEFLDWTPGNPSGCAARLKLMATVMAPGALVAEGSPKPLRYLAIHGAQGEADALQESVRDTYRHSLSTFYTWLRKVIVDAGLSAYPPEVKIPVVHQKILSDPYELAGTFTKYPGFVFDGDSEGVVNAAIEEFVARDGMAATIEVEDSPSMFDIGDGNSDPLHFSGKGEAMNGKACAEALAPLIDLALSFNDETGIVDICNEALGMIGESPDLESLSEDSTNAAHCRLWFPRARDLILSTHSWSFNTKRRLLAEVPNEFGQWSYAYAQPADCLRALAVLHKDAPDDTSMVFPPSGSIALPGDRAVLSNVQSAIYSPQDFSPEVDSEGMPVILTDQPEAMLRCNVRISDVTLYPPTVRQVIVCQLASMLAGPIIKGEAGRAEERRCLEVMRMYLAEARPIDSNQRQQRPAPSVPWQDAR